MNREQLCKRTLQVLLLIPVLLYCPVVAASQPVRSFRGRTLVWPVQHVHFADRAEAARAILDDRDNPYFGRLQPLEMAAKIGQPLKGSTLAEQQAYCRSCYRMGVFPFTHEDRDTLTWFVHGINAALRKDYPRFTRTGWNFIKTEDRVESGLPFTRGTYIVLSKSLLNQLTISRRRAARRGAVVDATDRIDGELIHEQSHIFQCLHPELFAKLYTNIWGFVHVRKIEENLWLREHQLLNPDGLDARWVYPIRSGEKTRWIWPTVVLPGDPGVHSLRSMQAVAVEGDVVRDVFRPRFEPGGKPVLSNLGYLAEYDGVFEPAAEVFHPNEIAADMFSRMVTEDILKRDPVELDRIDPDREGPPDPKVEVRFRFWCRRNL